MNKKAQNIIKPGARLFLLILLLFALVSFWFNYTIAIAELAVVAILGVYSLLNTRHQRRELVKFIENVTYNADSAKNNTLMNFPLPIVVFNMQDYQLIWGNQVFFELFGANRANHGTALTEIVPGFNCKWLMEGKTQYPGLVQIDGRKYQLHGNIVRSREGEAHRDYMGITYWLDVTEYDNIKTEYERSKPVMMLMTIDNYDELMKNVSDSGKSEIRVRIDDLVERWCANRTGLARRFDRDKYLFIFEFRYLEEITKAKFSILEQAHEIRNHQGIHMTLSIGVGFDGASLEESFAYANLASEMALSRGGDQAVIKNKYSFEFFGGRGMEVETRTKVKSRVTANALAELVRDSDQVFIMGHKQSDLDCIGAAAGLVCICRKLKTSAKIVVDAEENVSKKLISYLEEAAEYKGVFISPEDAMIRATSRTFLIVVDTNRPEQVQSRPLLESINRVAVIDHHRRAASYIQNASITFHEPYASSACELVAELMQELVEQPDILRRETEAVLSGIVLDTKNFAIRTGEKTFDAAAFLRRLGADTAQVKKMLQGDMEENVAKFKILQTVYHYRNSIAMAVCEDEQKRIVAAKAADEMLNISGVDASIVAYPTNVGGVVVSARSIGDVNVQLLLENLGGGGNMSSAGAQIENMSIKDAVSAICKSIDDYLDG